MWTTSQIQGLSKVSESDSQTAAATARRYLQGRYKPILDARPGDDSDWEWAAAAGLGLWFWRRRGVEPAVLTGQMAHVMDGLANEARAASMNRVTPVGSWALQMAGISKASALIAGAFAAGGWALINPALPDIETFIASELGYLNDFADDVAAGQVPRDGRFVRRAMLYGAAGWGFYMLIRGLRARDKGYDEERSVLDPGAEHCVQCVGEAGQEWQPIGSLIPIGSRQCRSHCRCRMQYRNRQGAVAE